MVNRATPIGWRDSMTKITNAKERLRKGGLNVVRPTTAFANLLARLGMTSEEFCAATGVTEGGLQMMIYGQKGLSAGVFFEMKHGLLERWEELGLQGHLMDALLEIFISARHRRVVRIVEAFEEQLTTLLWFVESSQADESAKTEAVIASGLDPNEPETLAAADARNCSWEDWCSLNTTWGNDPHPTNLAPNNRPRFWVMRSNPKFSIPTPERFLNSDQDADS